MERPIEVCEIFFFLAVVDTNVAFTLLVLNVAEFLNNQGLGNFNGMHDITRKRICALLEKKERNLNAVYVRPYIFSSCQSTITHVK